MVLSKRERVFKTLELNGESDMIPIHNFGFEQTGTSFQDFQNSKEKKNYYSYVENKSSRIKYYITQQRFWNVDIHAMDPWAQSKVKIKTRKAPPEYPDCRINTIDGRITKTVKQVDTGLDYSWYVGGYYTTPEILHSYWDRYGKPSELVNNRINYSPQVWEGFVEALSPYFYPMGYLPMEPVTSLYCGITLGRVVYYMRKNPQFIHEVIGEYTKVNVEIIKRYAEAGVDIAFFGDDLGYKGHSIFSLKDFREFIIPYYKKAYDECRKHGMLIVQHSCGYIDKLLPDMVDAGLDCIQSLEPAAGVDLKLIKETLGDRICLMGGIDSSRVLNFGTPNEVKEEVKRCIKLGGPNGGYFAGPSHDILNTPWENVLALRTALEKYRKYPLSV